MYRLNIVRALLLVILATVLSAIPVSWVFVLGTGFKSSLLFALVGKSMANAMMLIWFMSAVIGFIGGLAGILWSASFCCKFTNETVAKLMNDKFYLVEWHHALLILPSAIIALPIYTIMVVFIFLGIIFTPILNFYDRLKHNPRTVSVFEKASQPLMEKTEKATKPVEF